MKDWHTMLPVYYRLAQDIKRQVESGELKDGDMLPTEGQLGETYGISRMTVRQGLGLLAEAGLIETVKGKGTFVRRPRLNQLVINLNDPLAAQGKSNRYKVLDVKVLRNEPELARQLGLDEDAKIICLRRMLYINGQPAAVEEKHLAYLRGKPLLESQLEGDDFAELVAKHHDSVPVRNDMEIAVGVLSEEHARLLEEEPQQPALVIRQSIYAKDGKLLGTSRLVCHKDRYCLKATSFPKLGRL
ncbi:MAG: yvoA [Firmicutes bacterium]|nr:yvoA [Bacillota bacterium]